MLILEILLQLKSNQCGITAVFIHAKLEENEKIFVKIPKGFDQYYKRGKRRVLRLNQTQYGICQIPRAFWKYLAQKLIASEMLQYILGTCLFIDD